MVQIVSKIKEKKQTLVSLEEHKCAENYCHIPGVVIGVVFVVICRQKLQPYFSHMLIDSCYLNLVATGKLRRLQQLLCIHVLLNLCLIRTEIVIPISPLKVRTQYQKRTRSLQRKMYNALADLWSRFEAEKKHLLQNLKGIKATNRDGIKVYDSIMWYLKKKVPL